MVITEYQPSRQVDNARLYSPDPLTLLKPDGGTSHTCFQIQPKSTGHVQYREISLSSSVFTYQCISQPVLTEQLLCGTLSGAVCGQIIAQTTRHGHVASQKKNLPESYDSF